MTETSMDTLIRLGDIAVAIDELKNDLSPDVQPVLLAVAELLHDIVIAESDDGGLALYGEDDECN